MADWFQEYENYPVVEKSQIKWNFTKDFEVQGKYIVEDISSLIKNLGQAKDEELLRISQHCYNLLSWARQMAIMGFTGFQQCLDDLLTESFKDQEIIHYIQKSSFNSWIEGKQGQYKIGENYFTVKDGHTYYKRITGKWCLVDEDSVFNLMPNMEELEDPVTIRFLDDTYSPSPYHKIFLAWEKHDYKHEIPKGHFDIHNSESTPENEFDFAISKVKKIIDKPVSLQSVRDLAVFDDERLEYLIKLSYLMLEFVQTRRKSDEHTIYLLRDCVIFYELQKTLDIIEGRPTSSDQLIIGRKLMSNKKREGGHWYLSQEVLFFAYAECPENFSDFYNEYSRLLKEYEEHSEEFSDFVKKLARYIQQHIPEDLPGDKAINIVDLGFQGSINIFIKYVIDNHCSAGRAHQTKIHMYVLAEWFKSVYPNMYSTETYSLLTNIEVLARNELLYDYKGGSFMDKDGIRVVMGSQQEQKVANTELLVTIMTTIIAKNLSLI